ncbi:O-antigen ligase family protein [Aliikangiella sp. IMCC44653]
MKNSSSRFSRLTFEFLLVSTLSGYPIVAGLSILLSIENRVLSVPFRALVLTSAIFLFVLNLRNRSGGWQVFNLIWFCFWGLFLTRLLFEFLLNYDSFSFDWFEVIFYSIGVVFLPATACLGSRINVIKLISPYRLLIVSLFGLIVTLIALGSEIEPSTLLSGRLETDTLNPIAYGHLALTAIILSVWTYRQISLTKLEKVITIFIFLFSSFCLLIAGSRGPVLSLGIVVAVIFLRYSLSFKAKYLLKYSALAIVVASLLFILAGAEIYMIERISSSFFSDSARNTLLADSMSSFLENMLYGAWYPHASYPHNLIVESFMALGVIGGVCFLFLYCYATIVAFNVIVDNKIGWLALLFFQYGTFVLVSGSIFYANQFWVIMILISLFGYQSKLKIHK